MQGILRVQDCCGESYSNSRCSRCAAMIYPLTIDIYTEVPSSALVRVLRKPDAPVSYQWLKSLRKKGPRFEHRHSGHQFSIDTMMIPPVHDEVHRDVWSILDIRPRSLMFSVTPGPSFPTIDQCVGAVADSHRDIQTYLSNEGIANYLSILYRLRTVFACGTNPKTGATVAYDNQKYALGESGKLLLQ